MLTKKQKEEYIKAPGSCPYCGGEDIDGERFEADDNYGWRGAHCLDCDKRWQDLFTLTGIAEED